MDYNKETRGMRQFFFYIIYLNRKLLYLSFFERYNNNIYKVYNANEPENKAVTQQDVY